jgi:hypothetical protein
MLVALIVSGQQQDERIGESSISPTQGSGTISPMISPADSAQVPEGWQTYRSEEHGFSIMHPTDIDVEQRAREAVRFFKVGPSQVEGTEVFDAISLTFNSGSTEGESLRDFVEARHNEVKSEPVTESVSDIEPVNVSSYSGYQFTVVSLGEFTHIYLPKGESEYLHIINSTVDPTGQGFDETVETMFSTLTI